MSVHVMSWVFEESKAVGAARLVLLVIADHAKDHGGDSYPSLTRIALRAHMDQRTAQRAIKKLVESGEIAVSRSAGPHGVNRYRVPVPKGWQPAPRRGETPPAHRPQEGRDAPASGGETPEGAASDPPARDETPPESPKNHPVSLNSGEERNETLPASPVTEAPPKQSRCTRHRGGNPGDERCLACKADREFDERIAEKQRREETDRRLNCRDCNGTGWLEHPNTGLPAGRCTRHRRTA